MEQEEANIQIRALSFPYDARRSVFGDYLKTLHETLPKSVQAVLY